MGPNFLDEIDSGSFFDQIDDLIEFPPDNDGSNGNLIGSGDSKDFAGMWNDTFPESDPILSGSHADPTSDLSAELSVPYEDIVQLEWLSTFMDDSFSGKGMTIGKDNLCHNKEPSQNQFWTSSPVSVLESSSSSSSSSGGKTMPLGSGHRGPQRARSKRSRPATFSPRAPLQLISPSASFIEAPRPFVTPESENFAESPPMKKIPKPTPKPTGAEPKKKKIKIALPVNPDEAHNPNPTAQSVRKCMHCEITKTPQWRAGPMGPKTLCNACGVRYKSGRLFPEYRPAASPTFVPSLHSNSHKKVLEMRTKVGPGPGPGAGAEAEPTKAVTPTATKPNTEFGPNV